MIPRLTASEIPRRAAQGLIIIVVAIGSMLAALPPSVAQAGPHVGARGSEARVVEVDVSPSRVARARRAAVAADEEEVSVRQLDDVGGARRRGGNQGEEHRKHDLHVGLREVGVLTRGP